jgi:hypothetical protein
VFVAFVPTRPIGSAIAARPRSPIEDVTGDAPQPGERPRTESNPWSFADPDTAWWRHDTNESPQRGAGRSRSTVLPPEDAAPFAPEALDAHAAGVHDATRALAEPADGAAADAPHALAEPADGAAADAPHALAEPVDPAAPDATAGDPADGRAEPGAADVMILPEPGRARAAAVPGPAGQSRRQLAHEEQLENSPFWRTDEELAAADAAWPAPERHRQGRPTKPRGAGGLVALVALGLVAVFFAWVSAEPFWVAVGHGTDGTATVAGCSGSGVTQRCTGRFAAADGRFTVASVRLLGVPAGQRGPGATTRARMVSADSRQAYVGGPGLLLQLRWTLGFVLVVLCGVGIAGLTGTRRLPTVRERRAALLTSVAGPVALLAGFLLAAY